MEESLFSVCLSTGLSVCVFSCLSVFVCLSAGLSGPPYTWLATSKLSQWLEECVPLCFNEWYCVGLHTIPFFTQLSLIYLFILERFYLKKNTKHSHANDNIILTWTTSPMPRPTNTHPPSPAPASPCITHGFKRHHFQYFLWSLSCWGGGGLLNWHMELF